MSIEEQFDVLEEGSVYSQCANLFRCTQIGDVKIKRVSDRPPKDTLFTRNVQGQGWVIPTIEEDGEPADPENCCRLLEGAFRRKLKELGFVFRWSAAGPYVCFYPGKPHRESAPELFTIYATSFEFRFQSFHDSIYLAINPHVVIRTEATISDLVNKRVPLADLEGFHVTFVNDGQNRRGYLVASQKSGDDISLICTIRVTDTGELLDVTGGQVYPEARPELLQMFAEKVGIDCDITRLHRRLSYLDSTKSSADRLDQTLKVARYLAEKVFPLAFGGATFGLRTNPAPVRGTGFLAGAVLDEPILCFDHDDPSAASEKTYWGLRKFGPYDKVGKDICAACLGPEERMPSLKKLVHQLSHGSQRMPGGMKQFFWCDISVAEEVKVEGEDIESYERAARELLSRYRANRAIDIVFVYVPKTPEWIYSTPYYRCKALLAGEQLACQMVTPRALDNLDWSLLNIASAVFAKCRGVPWALAEESSPFDMVVGIAVHQMVGLYRGAAHECRFMGYANIFDEWGRWLFFEGTAAERSAPGQAHEQLNAILRTSVGTYESQRGKVPGRVAIHYWKRFSKSEREGILQVLKAVCGEDVKVVFVSINDDHPYRLYDRSVSDGAFPRGGYAVLHPQQLLLCTTGESDLSRKRIGTPRVLNIVYYSYPDGFATADDIARHVLGLTKLDYGTLTPMVREPVTLRFAGRIATLGAAMTAQEWNGLARPQTPTAGRRGMFFL